ncbi:hypothetical protein [Hymenobacter sp. YC55]|uniref:hypothetical protein n=1 Tax=Hymenobacter sp. YC55 TaxID=3034019 RepID=UPI0023F61D54|nr:hypothetical protein [Hymenobacter sp. YC55]MDF7812858.1 hypothetical protein [Hymenobacter sp. YC55]
MKIATYHRALGDNVRFFKGDLKDLVIQQLYEECLDALIEIDSEINWQLKQADIKKYIKTKKSNLLFDIGTQNSKFEFLLQHRLEDFADIFKKKRYEKKPLYDRIYVTTLFTFYWKITVETIHFCKKLVKNVNELHVGGVLASLLHEELEAETGIKPSQGLLDQPGMLDPNNPIAANLVIDNLPLDYSILDEIDYEYPTRSAYFTFMTKGCTRKCAFCSVPILEPTYKPKIETIDKFNDIKSRFGDQQNLLLMDNNVLASPKFLEIIEDIKSMGFYKGATYVEPNQLDIAIRNLADGYNNRGSLRRTHRLVNALVGRLKKDVAQNYYNLLTEYHVVDFESTTIENLLTLYPLIKDTYEKYRSKSPKMRYVDFNQGTDCRYVTEEIMEKLSEIPIRPLRIAFDYIGLKKQYVSAVRLAAKYGIRELSNYILYNFKDKPEDLWLRLKINIDLCKELDVAIFSFPMKYIPLFGEEAKHRDFTGQHWNKKFVRAIQSILNVTKGIVAPASKGEARSFFEKAFGESLEDFFDILYMPETYIVYRYVFENDLQYTPIWMSEYKSLNVDDLATAQAIIQKNIFTPEAIDTYYPSDEVRHFLRHYTIQRGNIEAGDTGYKKLKNQYDKLIKGDQFINLTLTYDFEDDVAKVSK